MRLVGRTPHGQDVLAYSPADQAALREASVFRPRPGNLTLRRSEYRLRRLHQHYDTSLTVNRPFFPFPGKIYTLRFANNTFAGRDPHQGIDRGFNFLLDMLPRLR